MFSSSLLQLATENPDLNYYEGGCKINSLRCAVDNNTQVKQVELEQWESPEIEELDVENTAQQPGVGQDGGNADCSQS